MWHLKTKLGTLWIVESTDQPNQFVLGLDKDYLGKYTSVERIIQDVVNQETGAEKWDEALKVKAPPSIDEWNQGEPDNW